MKIKNENVVCFEIEAPEGYKKLNEQEMEEVGVSELGLAMMLVNFNTYKTISFSSEDGVDSKEEYEKRIRLNKENMTQAGMTFENVEMKDYNGPYLVTMLRVVSGGTKIQTYMVSDLKVLLAISMNRDTEEDEKALRSMIDSLVFC